ncbi:MAG: hypothetical protein LBR29_08475 [Methylobacteriaceae bacterium]|nr:hypothetical protein [Methylobacteriaceae bacterium]
MMIYSAANEIGAMVDASRKFDQLGYAVGDMVSRQSTLEYTELNKWMRAAISTIMFPHKVGDADAPETDPPGIPGSFRIRISYFMKVPTGGSDPASGGSHMCWSYAYNRNTLEDGYPEYPENPSISNFTLPVGFELEEFSTAGLPVGFLYVETEWEYRSVVRFSLAPTMTFRYKHHFFQRDGIYVSYHVPNGFPVSTDTSNLIEVNYPWGGGGMAVPTVPGAPAGPAGCPVSQSS